MPTNGFGPARLPGNSVSISTPRPPSRQADRAPPDNQAPVRGRPPRCGTCGRCSRCRRWTDPEDALVDSLVGTLELTEIAVRLSRRFGLERTPTGISSRLKRRRKSRWMNGLSLRALERIFGLDHRSILRWWVDPGLLAGRRWSGRGPAPGWLFQMPDVNQFIREHVYMLDVARMEPGHPLTQLAALESRCQAWRSVAELAVYLQVSEKVVRQATRDGLIPHKRGPGGGRSGRIHVRADDFAHIRERLRFHRGSAYT